MIFVVPRTTPRVFRESRHPPFSREFVGTLIENPEGFFEFQPLSGIPFSCKDLRDIAVEVSKVNGFPMKEDQSPEVKTRKLKFSILVDDFLNQADVIGCQNLVVYSDKSVAVLSQLEKADALKQIFTIKQIGILKEIS